MNTLLDYETLTNRRLVELHMEGDRKAFRQIVERHQAMVCALGLSACGDVVQSEDLAQEVFVTAWRQLPGLREPEKLRGWLAGIARNLINNSFRRAGRTPTARAEPLSQETPEETAGPRERAINADESYLMWSALEGIPETYRDPMVLFYREQRSVTAVAEALEISEEAVRQRLSRGRALLSERMAKLVEETLERSAPTPAFASTVILALPVGPVAVETALGSGGAAAKSLTVAGTIGSAAVKGGVAIKLLAALAALPALMNGLTEYLRFRAHLEAPSALARRDIIKLHLLPLVFNGVLLGGLALVLWSPVPTSWKPTILVAFAIALIVFSHFDHRRRRLAAADLVGSTGPAFEYRSASGFLGLPWVHVRAGGGWRGKKAAGWIAISDGAAVGGLFASAPLAVAPICMGGIALGALSLGGLALGLASLGVCAGGGWAVGGMAVATQAAQGGLALAPDFAAGAWAMAAHANDAAAVAYFQGHAFFRCSQVAWQVAVWAAFFGWLPPLLLIGWHLGLRRAKAWQR